MAAINKNFVVKNGIEVGDNLIFGNKDQLRVGIGTTVPGYTLDVRGGIGATSVSVGQTLTANSGIITTLQPSKISVGGTTGVTGQYLKSTGTGLEWASFPTARTSSTFTATEGQTSFSFAYTVGLVDVFVNGVRLTDVEFTATDGLTVVLGTSCRVGDIVDIIGYAITGIGAGTSGIGGISVLDEGIVIGNNSAVTSINFVGASVTSTGTGAGVTVTISSPNTGYADTAGISTVSSGLTTTANINTSGIATISRVIVGSGTTFTEKLVVVGDARITGILTIGTASVTIDGSTNTLTVPNLVVTNSTSGVTASGVGITVRDGGGNLGSAEIIDFGDNLSVSFSAGIATITGSAAGAGGTWASNSVGIYTSRNVGIGTTNPTSILTVKGNTSLENLKVSGVSTFQGNLQLGDSDTINLGFGTTGDGTSDGDLQLFHNGTASYIRNNTGELYIQSPSQIGILDSTFAPMALFFENDAVHLYYNKSKKFETLGAGVTITGTTFTNNLSVSGISTFNSTVNLNGTTFIPSNQSLVFGSNKLSINYNSTGYSLISNSSAADEMYISGDGAKYITSDSRTSHQAKFIQGGAVELYYNGNKKFETTSTGVSVGGTISVDGGVTLATNNATIVGTSATAGEIKRIGGAPFFYDGSAWREFVLSSGTPVTQSADTEWDNVIFRATFDTDFTDAKFGVSPVYVGAGASIVGAAVTIGTGAFRNDGSVGAGISYAYRSDYDFTGSWTIEFWMYVDSGPVYYSPTSPVSLVSMHSTTGIGTSGNWTLAMWRDSSNNVYITWFNQNSSTYRGGGTLYNVAGPTWNSVIINKWNHFALVRQSNNGSLHFYINGTEQSFTSANGIIDNDIIQVNNSGLNVGGGTTFRVGNLTFNSNDSADVIIDDMRISAGVGTAGQRYTSIGISTYATFTPPTTALPTTGTLSSYVQPPGDKYGEIGLGTSPTWRGTSGVTVSQQSSGNYRVSFASSYTNSNDYYVLSQGMDQGFASYVGIARSITYVDLSINRQSNDAAVDTGSLAVQIKNHQ